MDKVGCSQTSFFSAAPPLIRVLLKIIDEGEIQHNQGQHEVEGVLYSKGLAILKRLSICMEKIECSWFEKTLFASIRSGFSDWGDSLTQCQEGVLFPAPGNCFRNLEGFSVFQRLIFALAALENMLKSYYFQKEEHEESIELITLPFVPTQAADTVPKNSTQLIIENPTIFLKHLCEMVLPHLLKVGNESAIPIARNLIRSNKIWGQFLVQRSEFWNALKWYLGAIEHPDRKRFLLRVVLPWLGNSSTRCDFFVTVMNVDALDFQAQLHPFFSLFDPKEKKALFDRYCSVGGRINFPDFQTLKNEAFDERSKFLSMIPGEIKINAMQTYQPDFIQDSDFSIKQGINLLKAMCTSEQVVRMAQLFIPWIKNARDVAQLVEYVKQHPNSYSEDFMGFLLDQLLRFCPAECLLEKSQIKELQVFIDLFRSQRDFRKNLIQYLFRKMAFPRVELFEQLMECLFSGWHEARKDVFIGSYFRHFFLLFGHSEKELSAFLQAYLDCAVDWHLGKLAKPPRSEWLAAHSRFFGVGLAEDGCASVPQLGKST